MTGAETGAVTGVEIRTETGAETVPETDVKTGAETVPETGVKTGAAAGGETRCSQFRCVASHAVLTQPGPDSVSTVRQDYLFTTYLQAVMQVTSLHMLTGTI